MLSHLIIRVNEKSILVYPPKFRIIVWRVVRRLRLCDRVSSPLSVMLSQLKKGMRRAIIVVL